MKADFSMDNLIGFLVNSPRTSTPLSEPVSSERVLCPETSGAVALGNSHFQVKGSGAYQQGTWDYWVGNDGFISRTRQQLPEQGGMETTVSGVGEPNVITAPVAPE